ncbi:MAG: cytochrome d ubiquinol oxidase subunit II [Zetaproteobacteria bacterium]|nr:MAG: cytochrome d ubiquinol oxidase subunit II [Zetaproteobacteria bacterium]
MIDYDTLRLIWWALLGVLLAGFGVTGGFDLGVGAMLRVLGRTDDERKVLVNVVAPTWDGNQVWLILGAGAVFAAMPLAYATSFSVLYPAMLAALFALFFRPTGFEYRAKVNKARWRNFWDWALVIGGALPAIVFGVAFGLILSGIPFHFDPDMRVVMDGGLWDAVTPFALFAGVVSLVMLSMHGAAFVNLKTVDTLQVRAISWMRRLALLLIVLLAAGGLWIAQGIEGYSLHGPMLANQVSTPLDQHVVREVGAWLNNFKAHPWMWSAPIAAMAGAALAAWLAWYPLIALLFSGISVAGVIATAGFAAFPFLLPSSTHPDHSLTIWNAAASPHTLTWMTAAAVVFVPIILAYTSWVFHVLRGPVRASHLKNNEYGTY